MTYGCHEGHFLGTDMVDYWNKIIQVLAKLSKGTRFKGHKHYELTNNANTAIGLAAGATILKIRTQN